MNLVAWIILGAVTGIIAHMMEKDESKNLLGAMLLGVLGSVLGGFLASLIFGASLEGFNIESLVVSTLGAATLLYTSWRYKRDENY